MLAERLLARHIKKERHCYREETLKRGLVEITDPDEHRVIATHMKKHRNLPPEGTACETGYSSLVLEASVEEVEVNPSLLLIRRAAGDSSAVILERLRPTAPKLPISCLSAAEHVIALQNEVTDFVSDYKPACKKRVMYRIVIQIAPSVRNFTEFETRLRAAIKRFDECLTDKSIAIHFARRIKRMFIEISTQIGDIQKLIKAITTIRECTIISPEFPDIGLNEGICLVKRDASNPIHALVNVAQIKDKKDKKDKKVFLERDAGLTSGLHTPFFQDSHWTFNPYASVKDLKQKTGYSDTAFAVKLYLKS